jgi:hypothetical protein
MMQRWDEIAVDGRRESSVTPTPVRGPAACAARQVTMSENKCRENYIA